MGVPPWGLCCTIAKYNIFYLHITFVISWERLEPGQHFLCLPFPQVGTTCPLILSTLNIRLLKKAIQFLQVVSLNNTVMKPTINKNTFVSCCCCFLFFVSFPQSTTCTTALLKQFPRYKYFKAEFSSIQKT